jgi:hypothetical protein
MKCSHMPVFITKTALTSGFKLLEIELQQPKSTYAGEKDIKKILVTIRSKIYEAVVLKATLFPPSILKRFVVFRGLPLGRRDELAACINSVSIINACQISNCYNSIVIWDPYVSLLPVKRYFLKASAMRGA